MISPEIATVFLDAHLRIQQFSPGACAFVPPLPAGCGRLLADLSLPPAYHDLPAAAERVLQTLEAHRFEVRSEQGRFHRVHIQPLSTGGATPEGVVISFVDVTEQKHQEALHRRQEHLHLLVESMREYAIIVMDASGRIETWNAGAARLFGYTEDEARGQPVEIIFTDADRQEGVPAQEMQTAAQNGHAEDDRWHVRKDGTRLWGTGLLMALRQPDGALRGFAKVLRDDTPRKEDEDTLREIAARFRQMAEAVPDIVFTTTPDGTVEYVNARREEITGYPPETVLGTKLWPDFVHPDDRPQAVAMWEEARARQQPFTIRYRLRSSSGGYCWFIARARPIFSNTGEVVRWFGTATDVDLVTRAEQEIKALNETLEARVEERTEQVRTLAASLTLAEHAERQRIAQILHDDLQQILYGLGLTLGMLGRPRSGEEAQQLIEQATDTLNQAIQTTRSLVVELSPPVLKGSDISQLLEWIGLRVETQYALKLDVEVQPGCRVADPALRVLLYQLLREVLFNIVKHAGTDRAAIRAWRSGEEVTIEVEDAGRGFDVAAIEARRTQRGGFGLFSVRERVELIGGRFSIASSPGAGTRVTIVVPDRPVEAAP